MTPRAALRAAQAYVARHRPDSVVTGLREDADAFLVETELLPEYGDIVVLGPGPLVMDKATGRIEDLSSAAGGDDRWERMTEVAL